MLQVEKGIDIAEDACVEIRERKPNRKGFAGALLLDLDSFES